MGHANSEGGYRPTSGGDNSNPPDGTPDSGGDLWPSRDPAAVWYGAGSPGYLGVEWRTVEWFRLMFHPIPMLLAGLLGWLLWR